MSEDRDNTRRKSQSSTRGAKVARFEDLIAWQKTRRLAAEVYRATATGPIARDFDLRNQWRDASVSTMSNIAEGFDRGSAKEFHRFLRISKASCAELRSQFYVALDVGHFSKDRFDYLSALAQEVSRIIGGLMTSVARRFHTKQSKGRTPGP